MKSRAAVAPECIGNVNVLRGDIDLAPFITHNMPLEQINDAFDLMHEGKSIRAMIHF